MTPRLKTKYFKEIVPKLQKELGYSSPMQVPRIEKITINQCIGIATKNPKMIDNAVEELTMITGQKAVPVKAKKAISNFNLRIGMPIAARVTLRGARLYEFLDRLTSLALPRVRDFRGINKKSFDKRGNYTLGVKMQTIFPEISIEKVTRNTGMDITFVTTAKDDQTALRLLKELGMPF